jgi:hypothetical protein
MSARQAALLCALLPNAAGAAELSQIAVDYKDGTYTVESEVRFDVGQHALYSVFSDWDLATQFSSAFVASHNIAPDESGRSGFYVLNHGCVVFYCKTFERSGYVQLDPDSLIEASADPTRSDFEFSDERWTFNREGDATIVRYSLRMKPAFWVPPVIGPYLIKRKLRNDSGEALNRIEEIAQQREQASD